MVNEKSGSTHSSNQWSGERYHNKSTATHMVEKAHYEELRQFEELVDHAAAAQANFPIANAGALHARYLNRKLFGMANEEACIYTGELLRQTQDGVEVYQWEDMIYAAIGFLRVPDSELSIIVEKEIDGGLTSHPLLKALREDKELRKGKVKIYQVPKSTKSIREKSKDIFASHFMVTDAGAREEYDIDGQMGRANFGDRAWMNELRDRFQRMVSIITAQGSALIEQF